MTFRTRMVVALIGLATASAAVASLVTLSISASAHLKAETGAIAAALGQLPDYAAMSRSLDDLLGFADAQAIRLVDADLDTVELTAVPGVNRSDVESELDTRLVSSAAEQQGPVLRTVSGALKVAAPIWNDRHQFIGGVVVTRTDSPQWQMALAQLQSDPQSAGLPLLGLALLAAGVALLLAWPVARICNAAGDLDSYTFKPGTLAGLAKRETDIGRLARLLQRMANAEDGWRRSLEALRESRDELEVRVVARTKDLAEKTQELEDLNRTLEERVATQVTVIERMNQLRRFLSPHLAEAVINAGDEGLLEWHRRQISVVFVDLRGFTAFSETAEPEDLQEVLREYHEAVGTQVQRFDGTVGFFAGDGLMVFFNDPLPCPDPGARALGMAAGMRDAMDRLKSRWSSRQYTLGFGAGVAVGYATLGRVGFEGRYDYTAIGPVVNQAARLCDEAKDGQILITERLRSEVEQSMEYEYVDELKLKGLVNAVQVYNVLTFHHELSVTGRVESSPPSLSGLH